MPLRVLIEVPDQVVEQEVENVFSDGDLIRYIGYWADQIDGFKGSYRYAETSESGDTLGKEFVADSAFGNLCVEQLVKMGCYNPFTQEMETDSSAYDLAVQFALFGEQKYS